MIKIKKCFDKTKQITLKLTIILVIAFLGVFLVSCQNNDDDNFIYKKDAKLPNVSTKIFAKKLAYAMQKNPNIIKTINNSVDIISSYGLDENLTVFDILNTDKSVFFSKDNFGDLKSVFSIEELKNAGFSSDDYYGNLNIYWGYHDDWDGKTNPIVCYIDNTTTSTITKGFKIEKDKLVDVEISEEEFDSEKQPIIVVNVNDLNYAVYPDFKNGIRIKDGVDWNEWIDNGDNDANKISVYNNPKKIYKAGYTYLQSGGHQYDSWWAGGSEFYIEATFATTENTGTYAEHSCPFTRKQIKHKVKKSCGFSILNSDWRTNFLNVDFRLFESDGGSKQPFTVSLNILNKVSFNVSVPKRTYDDLVGQVNVSRDSFMASYDNGDKLYQLGDCTLTTDLKIYNRPTK